MTAKDVDFGVRSWAICKALVSHHRLESTTYLVCLEVEVVVSQGV